MLLNELLDTQVKGKILLDNTNFFRAKARIGGRTIVFEAEAHDNAAETGVWSIVFVEETDDGDETTAATGSGNELKVFAFVKDCFKTLIRKRKPNLLLFSADHDGKNQGRNSRAELYKRLLEKFKVPGYKLSYDDMGSVQFYFEKEGSNAKEEYVDN